jgi:hypothetical protein
MSKPRSGCGRSACLRSPPARPGRRSLYAVPTGALGQDCSGDRDGTGITRQPRAGQGAPCQATHIETARKFSKRWNQRKPLALRPLGGALPSLHQGVLGMAGSSRSVEVFPRISWVPTDGRECFCVAARRADPLSTSQFANNSPLGERPVSIGFPSSRRQIVSCNPSCATVWPQHGD